MTIRVVVVDDEPMGLRGIVARLAGRANVSIVAQCENGAGAVDAIRTHRPDLVFLDVQMPGVDGFDVLRQLEPDERPHVVFVTAHDRHAVRAFDMQAVDYILKPIDDGRFEEALERAVAAVHAEEDRLVIRLRDRTVFVRKEEIDWVGAEGDYVRIHAGAKSWLVRGTIGGMESELGSRLFLRIHRSTIVNVEQIAELRSIDDGGGEVLLRSGARLRFGRTYRPAIDRLARR